MKLIIVLILLVCSIGCRGPHSNGETQSAKTASMADGEITTKLTELDGNKDGKADTCMETFYRGGVKVLMVYSRADTNGVMRVNARTYFVNGSIVLSEGDHDGDGVFETILASHPETKDLEVFTRTVDGGVRPASTRTVNAHKKQMSAVAEFFQEMPEVGGNSDDFDERFRAAKKKIEDAEKEKDE